MKVSSVGTLTILVLLSLAMSCQAQLKYGFYRGKCGFNDVEIIIRRIVAARFAKDPTITPALIRMQFHDCFVHGCDASLLLDGDSSEKMAIPNLTVRGYDLIDEVKDALEKACPGVVSCADIIVAATRDAIALAGGWPYAVQMGRRDGRVSLASNVDLPAPFFSVAQSIAAFQKKNLTTTDMVILLGGHTVGIAHCANFVNRLYNFNGTNDADKTMDPNLVTKLRTICPQNVIVNNFTSLDQNKYSSNIIDNSFYKQIIAKKGILQIDQSLALDSATKNMVTYLANGFNFQFLFNNAMVKMGAIEVLTGTQGDIRKSCRAINLP
ncbi:Peroxidase protein [Dioscorea alata]|uniref:Peroxidase protein n=1 Tax=Dioscorea alata TaxID=55571 RepID=A0ACB7WVL0_DIOAL|nr:Peroxidase protein [Dioscorea alata]